MQFTNILPGRRWIEVVLQRSEINDKHRAHPHISDAFIFSCSSFFFFFAFGQRQVTVLIKYFAGFKRTINALGTSATTRNVLSWDEFLSFVHISVILVVQLLKIHADQDRVFKRACNNSIREPHGCKSFPKRVKSGGGSRVRWKNFVKKINKMHQKYRTI